jgi:hypothetical protein
MNTLTLPIERASAKERERILAIKGRVKAKKTSLD